MTQASLAGMQPVCNRHPSLFCRDVVLFCRDLPPGFLARYGLRAWPCRPLFGAVSPVWIDHGVIRSPAAGIITSRGNGSWSSSCLKPFSCLPFFPQMHVGVPCIWRQNLVWSITVRPLVALFCRDVVLFCRDLPRVAAMLPSVAAMLASSAVGPPGDLRPSQGSRWPPHL